MSDGQSMVIADLQSNSEILLSLLRMHKVIWPLQEHTQTVQNYAAVMQCWVGTDSGRDQSTYRYKRLY